MHRTPIALLMLALGAAIGVLVGFTAGSGQALQPRIVEAGLDGIERTERLIQSTGEETLGASAASTRSSATPDFRAALAPLDIAPESPVGKLTTGIAAVAKRDAETVESQPTDARRSITGVALDHKGKALEGVTVTITMNPDSSLVSTKSADSIAQDWEGEQDLAASLRERAASTLNRRRLRRVDVTDANGRFELTNLLPGRHYVRAYSKGYVFRSRSTYVGNSTTVTGKPAEMYHLEVVGPDDAPVDQVTIGVAKDNRWTYYDWDRENPYLPLSERTARLRAFAGGPLMGDKKNPFAKLASEERRVHLDIDGEGPHRFEVKPTRSLTVTVVDQTADGPTLPFTVRCGRAKKLDVAGGRPKFEGKTTTVKMSSDGLFRMARLNEGEYLLGVGRGGDEPEVFRELLVTDGPLEETVVLPPVQREDFLVVKAYSPRGSLLSGLSFSLWTLKEEGGVRSRSLSGSEREPGEYWVGRPTAENTWNGPAKLVVKCPGFGSIATLVSRDQGSVRVDFEDPCKLKVHVQADAEEMFEVSLQVTDSLSGSASRTLASMSPLATKGQGFVIFDGVQPGLAKISMNSEGRRNWSGPSKLAVAEVLLRSGEQEASLSATTLYDLEIHAPGEEPGTGFYATAIGSGTESELGGRSYGALGNDHLVTLSKLPPGRYKLSVQAGDVPPIEVTIPSSAIDYERPTTVGYRVSASRKGRDTAPLIPGDIITEVNGESIAVGSISSRVQLAVAEGPTTLTLVRDGDAMELSIETAPKNVRYAPLASLK
jgi:hypothetical protein